MKSKLINHITETFPRNFLRQLRWYYPMGILILFLISSCGDKEDGDPQNRSVEGQIQGSWVVPEPKIQYLGENGNVLHEEPDTEGVEMSFDNNIATVIEEDGFVYSLTYNISQASGKDFINLLDDGFSQTFELTFPSNNQMVWTRKADIITSNGVGWYDDNSNFNPASTVRYYYLFTKI